MLTAIDATTMSDGGELELTTLLQGMTPVLHPDILVFLNLTNADNPPAEIRDKSVFTFREQEGNTYVVDREVVERLGYQYEFPCRRVTLNIHSSLQAVGSTRLQRVKVKNASSRFLGSHSQTSSRRRHSVQRGIR